MIKKSFSSNSGGGSYSNNRRGQKSEIVDNKIIANEKITAKIVQVISFAGQNLGNIPLEEALFMAEEENLDLVMVSENSTKKIPVVKLMNLNKKIYEEKKKLAKSKKNQHEVKLKEIRISVKIGENDLRIKMKQASEFLIDGMKVKVVLVMRGREKSTKATFGVMVFDKAEAMVKEFVCLAGKVLLKEIDMDTSVGWYKIFYIKSNK